MCEKNRVSFIVTLNNDLYGSGKNSFGQFGNGECNSENVELLKINTSKWLQNKEKITDIKCGSFHTVFLTSYNNAYTCGDN